MERPRNLTRMEAAVKFFENIGQAWGPYPVITGFGIRLVDGSSMKTDQKPPEIPLEEVRVEITKTETSS